MSEKFSLIAYRGTNGVGFIYGPPKEDHFENFPRDPSPTCKDMAFSNDGSLFAWCNGEKMRVVSTCTFKAVFEIEKSRTAFIQFSPSGKYICTWEPYVSKGSAQESANLEIWNVKTGALAVSFIQKKQTDWHPQWTDDEQLCARNVSNEVHFYENGDFSKIAKKIFMQKVSAFSLATGPPNYHVACYVPGVKGQPSFVKLFAYPKFEGLAAAIAQKSFFKADKVEFYWHKLGKDLIVQATVDVDKSGASYYGEQYLYYLSVKSEDTARIKLGKDGPIYSLQWSPSSPEFCVVYGFMPAKATIYNLKCEPVFDFGTGPRNIIQYTMSGNKLSLSGFGNLRGNIEIWDLKKKKQICDFVAVDSTYISWSPDGEHILTATTSPRLRIGNGYRIWHYTGSLLQEKYADSKEELWDLKWLPLPEDKVAEKPTSYAPVQGIQSSQPLASKEVYRPPGAKGQPSSFKLHQNEPAKNASQAGNDLQQQPLTKNQKKNQAKKAKKEKEQEKAMQPVGDCTGNNETNKPIFDTTQRPDAFTGIPEKDKKIRALYKKLDQIEKLKKDREAGKHLELNQLEKLKKENEVVEELQKLML